MHQYFVLITNQKYLYKDICQKLETSEMQTNQVVDSKDNTDEKKSSNFYILNFLC